MLAEGRQTHLSITRSQGTGGNQLVCGTGLTVNMGLTKVSALHAKRPAPWDSMSESEKASGTTSRLAFTRIGRQIAAGEGEGEREEEREEEEKIGNKKKKKKKYIYIYIYMGICSPNSVCQYY